MVVALQPTKASAQDRKLDSFTISYASVSGTRGPLWIAKDLGLFEKYGLEGNLIYIASGVVSVNALLGGSAAFGLHGKATTRWSEEYQESLYEHQVAMLGRGGYHEQAVLEPVECQRQRTETRPRLGQRERGELPG